MEIDVHERIHLHRLSERKVIGYFLPWQSMPVANLFTIAVKCKNTHTHAHTQHRGGGAKKGKTRMEFVSY